MTKEQTTWEEEFELLKLNDTWYCGGNQDNVEILREETKQFISETISQEKEKMIRIIEDNIPKPSPENPNVDEPYYRIINLLQNK